MSGSIIKTRRAIILCLLFACSVNTEASPKVFNILNYKAKGDGVTINTRSIQAAIDACSKSGGGTVLFPAGRYVSGTIYLKSHVTLYLEAGAVLEGSKNLKDYPVTISKVRSYTDNYTDKSLIYAEDLESISITGKGMIDGNGAWFKVENMENSEELRKKDDFAFYKYRPYLIRIINCKNILVRDITLLNSPMWVQHYLLCEDVNIDGIKVNSRVNHNNDGIDIDGCQRVRISNCDIISGDDAVVLKSTLAQPCKNVTITNCTLSSNCNAFKMGTETNGGFENVVVSNCTIYDTHLAGTADGIDPVISKNSTVILDGNRLVSSSGNPTGRYVNCNIRYTDDREIRINTPAAVKSKRMEIISAIWGAGQIPDRSDVIVTPGVKSPLDPDPVVSRVDRFDIPVMSAPEGGAEPGLDLAYYFVPVKRNNRLVILNPGHTCKLSSQPDNDYRIEPTIKGLLQAGFDVLAVFMPHVSETTCNLDHCSVMNTDTGPGDHPATFGLRYFLQPEIVSLNYLLLQSNYKDINMVGLSGGGWTTNLLAAIDERIKYSFSVAGSMPVYYRSGGSMGDIEQFLPELYRDIAGYPDLYVLGAFGKGRKQVQILNRNDDCCFGQKQHDADRNYDKDLKTFESSVKEKLTDLGADGQYYLVIDETAPNHQISVYALTNVILKELNKK
jgi:hypothetical protein